MNEYLETMLLQCESHQKKTIGRWIPEQKGKQVCFLEHPGRIADAENYFELVTAQLPVKALLMEPEKVAGANKNPSPPAVDMELLDLVGQARDQGLEAKLGWAYNAELDDGGSFTVRASGRDEPHNPGIDIVDSSDVVAWLKKRYGEQLSKQFRESKKPRIEVKFVGA